MLAFVTGGTGFLGSNLVAALGAQGIRVRVLRRPGSSVLALRGVECEHRIGDVLDAPPALAAAMAGCTWVFHTAGIADYWRHRTSDLLYRTNVDGTRNVLAAARQAGVERLVFTSSLAAMGVPRGDNLLDETNRFNLAPRRFPYGHSKHLAETEVARAVAAGLAAVTVNPSVVIGPRDLHQISGSLVVQAARGLLRVAPPGGVNFVAVDDAVAGHIAAAQRGRVGERYILAGENLSYRAAFATACAVVGRPGPRVVLPQWTLPLTTAAVAVVSAVAGARSPVDARQTRLSFARLYANGAKADRELGAPKMAFRAAVERAYEWYVANDVLRRGVDDGHRLG